MAFWLHDRHRDRTQHSPVFHAFTPIPAFPLTGGRGETPHASGLPLTTISPHSSIDIKPPAASALF
jgi:hypothetical protein